MRATNQPHRARMLVLFTLCAPALATAQQIKPMSLTQMEGLFSAGVADVQILQTAREGCIDFRINNDAEQRLNKAGATNTFVTSLRGVCYGLSRSVKVSVEQPPQQQSPTAVAPMTITQMERLFVAGVPDAQILQTAREGCIDFRID